MTKKINEPPAPSPFRDALPTMTYEGAVAMADAVLMCGGSDDRIQLLMVEAVLSLAPTGDWNEDFTRRDRAQELVRELLKRTSAFESLCTSIKEMLADPQKQRELYSAVYDEARERNWLRVSIKAK